MKISEEMAKIVWERAHVEHEKARCAYVKAEMTYFDARIASEKAFLVYRNLVNERKNRYNF